MELVIDVEHVHAAYQEQIAALSRQLGEVRAENRGWRELFNRMAAGETVMTGPVEGEDQTTVQL